jgi:urea transport system permease protein
MLGALFILVTLLLPKGILGSLGTWWEAWSKQAITPESTARKDVVSEPKLAE